MYAINDDAGFDLSCPSLSFPAIHVMLQFHSERITVLTKKIPHGMVWSGLCSELSSIIRDVGQLQNCQDITGVKGYSRKSCRYSAQPNRATGVSVHSGFISNVYHLFRKSLLTRRTNSGVSLVCCN